jgi:hypothetical protein
MTRLSAVAGAVAVFGFAACDSTGVSLVNDAVLTADVASSAGEAIASAVYDMNDNEQFGGMPGAGNLMASLESAPTYTYSRTRTCWNATGTVVNNCSPISSVRKVAVHVTVNGSRSGSRSTTGDAGAEWSGVVHRTADDTVTRNFTGTAETSRTHSGVSVGNDTTTFTEGDFTRVASETARDTVKLVTWNLPRLQNRFPVSGSIVRAVNVKVEVSNGDRSASREFSRLVTVTFPPDAQGNVVLTINDRTCNLNLDTRRVTNCQ